MAHGATLTSDMAALLALATSVLYGLADFLGGLASRRRAALSVATVSQAIGVVALVGLALVLPPGAPTRTDLGWGAATGLAGAFALGLFYQALSVGRMTVVAPVAAATGDAVAVIIGLASGERPSVSVEIGFALALVSIVLVGQEPAAPGERAGRGVMIAALSGMFIGVFYACLHHVSVAAGIWPLLVARAVSLPLLAACTVARGHSLRVPRSILPLLAACGILDIAANVCYLIAVRIGLLSVVATLASLYPTVTVVLAWWFLRERLRVPQYVGLIVGAAAMVMISRG